MGLKTKYPLLFPFYLPPFYCIAISFSFSILCLIQTDVPQCFLCVLCLGCHGQINLPLELVLLESTIKPTTLCEFSLGTIDTRDMELYWINHGHMLYQKIIRLKLFNRNLSLDLSQVLEWENRYKIAVGICKALVYLHDGSPWPVIHMNVKTSNFFLSQDFQPQVKNGTLHQLNVHQLCAIVRKNCSSSGV